MLRRADIVDFLVVGEESLVLTQTQCLRLAAVPTALLAYLEEPRTVEQATAHLTAEFGPAPDGRLQQVIDDLVGHDLVRTE